MRTRIPLFLLALLAQPLVATGCREQLPSGSASGGPPPSGRADPRSASQEHLAALQADWPRVIFASDTATNYAPPGWPLEPGDRVTHHEATRLISKFGIDAWGRRAVVWVVRDTNPTTATPFGAWFSREKGMLHGEPEPSAYHLRGHKLYHGHFPVRAEGVGHGPATFEEDLERMEALLPPSLRGFVDHRRHLFDSEYSRRRKSFGGYKYFYEAERKAYYGVGASW